MKRNFSILGTLATIAYRYAYWVLAITVLLVIVSIGLIRHLSIDADLTALLPDSFASVQDLDQAKQRFGGFGYVVVVASGSDPVKLRQFADDIAPKLTAIEQIQFVAHQRTNEFFEDRALYFLTIEDLNTVLERINERWRWEKRKRNPLFIELETESPPSVDFSDIRDNYLASNGAGWMSIQQAHDNYYFSQDQKKIAILVKPHSKVTNLDYSRKLIESVQRVVDAMPMSEYAVTSIELTGRYKKQIDLQAQVQKDLAQASTITLALVIAYLFIHFRRLSALIYISIPLAAGIFYTLGLAYLVFEQLNILTSFIGVILLGLGIDHGIHLYSRYREELRNSTEPLVIVLRTFSSTGRAVTMAALTTLTSFIALGLSDFRAFHEFGLIAAFGMFFIVTAYALCMPALLRVISFRRQPLPTDSLSTPFISSYARYLQRYRTTVIIVASIVALAFVVLLKDVKFNYDFESLSSGKLTSFLLDKEVNELLGHSQTPMVAMANDTDSEKFLLAQLRNDKKVESDMQFVLGLSDLIPADQAEKSALIDSIGKIVKKINTESLQGDEAKNFEKLTRQVLASQFAVHDLPPQISALFGVGVNGLAESAGGNIILSPAVSLSDGDAVRKLAGDLRELQQPDGSRLPIAGETMVLADVLDLIFSELPKVFVLTSLVIFSMLWLSLKTFKNAILCFGLSTLTISLTLGIMTVFNIELNYINILILPVLLGLSVDSGIHMITRALEGDEMSAVLNETGLAITGSALTSIFGMLGLALADHHGLSSLGLIAIIGLTVNLVLSFTLMAVLLPRKYSARHSSTEASTN